MIRHLQQPKDSHLCGQTCVAMITGVSIEKSIEVFGTRGGTRTKQVVAALRKFGIATVTPRLVRWNGQQRPPDYAILHMIWKSVSGRKTPWKHWLLCWAGVLYDPSLPEPRPLVIPSEIDTHLMGGIITSYLEIKH